MDSRYFTEVPIYSIAIIIVVITIACIKFSIAAHPIQMNWYRRFGYAVLASVLVSGIATIAPVFTANHTAVYVLAPIVSLPFVFRILFDIASEYELVPESTPDTIQSFFIESLIGGVLAASALYIIHTSLPIPPILADRLLYVAFVTEWVVAYALVLRRIRASNDAAA